MNDQTIEQEIQAKGKTAPRITPADIEANIKEVYYFTAGDGYCGASGGMIYPTVLGLLTFCVLELQNGFTVTGKSACVSAENFDAEIGRKVARQDAINQMWPLMGYALAEKLYQQRGQMDHIARVCHEVNRAYCESLGDYSQPSWEDAPEWQRASARMGVDLHLMGDFGPEASHISWMKQKLDEGWQYGPIKDAEKKEHPCIVPFAQLPREQQAKDYIFRAVVHALRNQAGGAA